MPRLIDHSRRREEIAEAAWRVILRDGVGGASVRTVAAEAGLSTGSLRHLFASQAELLVFALQLVLDRVTARVAAMSPKHSPTATVEAVAAELLPLDRPRRAEMEVYLALCTAANTDGALRDPRDAAHRRMRDACRWMITHLGAGACLAPGADHELEAIRLHAVIDGLAAHLIYEAADQDPAWALEALVHHIRSLRGAAPR